MKKLFWFFAVLALLGSKGCMMDKEVRGRSAGNDGDILADGSESDFQQKKPEFNFGSGLFITAPIIDRNSGPDASTDAPIVKDATVKDATVKDATVKDASSAIDAGIQDAAQDAAIKDASCSPTAPCDPSNPVGPCSSYGTGPYYLCTQIIDGAVIPYCYLGPCAIPERAICCI